MTDSAKICVIVDGYKLSKAYVEVCRVKGFQCVHVQSTEKPLFDYEVTSTYQHSDYLENFIYCNNLSEIVRRLQSYSIVCVIPATEVGVSLADDLAKQLCVAANDFSLTVARRNKFFMIEAVKSAGLLTAQHCKSKSLDELLAWARMVDRWPLVLKPLDSCGSDNVFICYSFADMKEAFRSTIHSINICGLLNFEVLAQTYLDGQEYIVNTVSCKGKHYVTDICEVTKRFINPYQKIYDREKLLNSVGHKQANLIEYTDKVLDSLGISIGPAHTELMLTESGPALIETAARMSGCINRESQQICIGRDPIEIAVDAYTCPEDFFQKTKTPYHLTKHTMEVMLCSEKSGKLISMPLLSAIQSLPSFHAIKMQVRSGDVIEKTIDLKTSAGRVTLIHEDESILEADYQQIKSSERLGFEVVNENAVLV